MSDPNKTALAHWLQRYVPGGPSLQLRRISGGQSNPTWFVDWGMRRLVLRAKPKGTILPGAHAVEREFRVQMALRHTSVPVPDVLALEEDASVLGSPFYVMERIEGRVFPDCTLPGLAPAERRAIYLDMARTLARLHAVRPQDVGLSNYGKPGNYFERQLARWSQQYMQSDGQRIDALDRVIPWLRENMPEDDGAVSITHGDFRLGNMIFAPEAPRVAGVLDWELSTLGHPLADLGFCVIPWHATPEEYGGIRGTGWEGSGIPTREDFIAEYFAHSVLKEPLLPFHTAFAMFRFAVIFQGIADRARHGSAASDEAASLGPLAERFARRAAEVAGI